MLARLCLTSLLLLLAACQNTSVNRDYDSSRDFGAYRSWSWQEPALQYRPDDPRLRSDLTEQRVRDALSEQLEQRGLRAAALGTGADLKVQAWLIVDERQEQISTHYGGAWGGWNDYWAAPGYTETRRVDYQVATLQLDLFDAKDGKLVWRGSAKQIVREQPQSPEERTALIRTTVAKLLAQYPPH